MPMMQTRCEMLQHVGSLPLEPGPLRMTMMMMMMMMMMERERERERERKQKWKRKEKRADVSTPRAHDNER